MLSIQKNLIKTIPYIIIVLLIAALSITQCSKQKFKAVNHDSELKHAINLEKAKVVSLSNQAATLKRDLYKQREKDSVSLIASNRLISYWKKKALQSRVRVDTLIKANPHLQEFVNDQDSVIAVQDNTIDTLTAQGSRQWKSFTSILSVEQEKFQASKQINEHLEMLNKDLNKRVKRERAKKTVWKIVAGGLAAGILYQAVSN